MENQQTTEQLLKKIEELELCHKHLKQEMSNLMTSSTRHRLSHSVSPHRVPRRRLENTGSTSFRHSSPLQRESRCDNNDDDGLSGHVAIKFTDNQLLNILQSTGQAIHIFDLDGRLIYWNRSAEIMFGYTAEEALGRNAIELLCDSRDHDVASSIVHRVGMGQTWTGQFPVKHKRGHKFVIVVTDAPFLDDNGNLVGVIVVSDDSRRFEVVTEAREMGSGFSRSNSAASAKLGLDLEQPLQTALVSKISCLASKVSNKIKSKMRPVENFSEREGGSGDNHYSDREDAASSSSSTPRGDIHPSPFGIFSTAIHEENYRDLGNESESKPSISRILSTKAEAWMGRKGLAWPWKGNEWDGRTARFVRPCLHNDQENSCGEMITFATLRLDNQVTEANRTANKEATGSWSSSVNINSSSSASSCGSTSGGPVNKADFDSDSLDCELLWEDLTVGEQIGEGSCGTVYHALLYGSDVAVKVFSRQEYSEDLIFAFRQEVLLMKKLRHPNILLFMGAVTSLQRLCIVTEFLPRGSLFRLLKRNATKLEWRRRIHMALDIARGMNYLHRRNPPIVHRDLKSSNLLVDKNWTVKVGDFGLSRLKTQTYLTTKTGKGTPQWMAPEVLRNESSDEKSDIYSYGVILWELVTQKIPWESLNSMQVIGAVGFMNQRLDIPNDVDPQWASIIESCWHDEPRSRPSFQELTETLKDLQRKYALQLQTARAVPNSSQNEL